MRRGFQTSARDQLSRWRYADVPLGVAVWSRGYLLQKVGSGYPPGRLMAVDIVQRLFYPVKLAPGFTRNIHLVVDDNAVRGWPWLDNLLAMLQQG